VVEAVRVEHVKRVVGHQLELLDRKLFGVVDPQLVVTLLTQVFAELVSEVTDHGVAW